MEKQKEQLKKTCNKATKELFKVNKQGILDQLSQLFDLDPNSSVWLCKEGTKCREKPRAGDDGSILALAVFCADAYCIQCNVCVCVLKPNLDSKSKKAPT